MRVRPACSPRVLAPRARPACSPRLLGPPARPACPSCVLAPRARSVCSPRVLGPRARPACHARASADRSAGDYQRKGVEFFLFALLPRQSVGRPAGRRPAKGKEADLSFFCLPTTLERRSTGWPATAKQKRSGILFLRFPTTPESRPTDRQAGDRSKDKKSNVCVGVGVGVCVCVGVRIGVSICEIELILLPKKTEARPGQTQLRRVEAKTKLRSIEFCPGQIEMDETTRERIEAHLSRGPHITQQQAYNLSLRVCARVWSRVQLRTHACVFGHVRMCCCAYSRIHRKNRISTSTHLLLLQRLPRLVPLLPRVLRIPRILRIL